MMQTIHRPPPYGIDLWFAFLDEVGDPALLDRYRQIVTKEEAAQADRFHFERDSLRYLVTRTLARTALSRYIALPPSEWKFAADSYGKPKLLNELPGQEQPSFNLSHTQGLVMLGVTFAGSLGVDVEYMKDRESRIELAERYFARHEVDELRALPASRQNERFLELWTLKESYLKALGVGLSMPLDGIGFSLQPDRGISASANATGWTFMQFQAGPSHLGAICFEDRGMERPWEARKVVPLVSERGFELEVRRTSGIQRNTSTNKNNDLMEQ